jgi:hypothetical protein
VTSKRETTTLAGLVIACLCAFAAAVLVSTGHVTDPDALWEDPDALWNGDAVSDVAPVAISDDDDVPTDAVVVRAALASRNWAGYVAVPKAAGKRFEHVMGTWTVPAGACTAGQTTYSSTWIGIGGYSDKELDQIGTDADCSSSGTIAYSAWYETLPAPGVDIPMDVAAGDTVDAIVSTEDGRLTMSLRDRTSGETWARRFPDDDGGHSSAEWIVEAPTVCDAAGRCHQSQLTAFGRVPFTEARARLSTDNARGVESNAERMAPVRGKQWWYDKLTLKPANEASLDPASALGAMPSPLSRNGKAFAVVTTGDR